MLLVLRVFKPKNFAALRLSVEPKNADAFVSIVFIVFPFMRG